jgi:hypothetical protein
MQTELVNKRIQWIPQINTIIFSTTTEAKNAEAITSNNRLALPLSWASMDCANSLLLTLRPGSPETASLVNPDQKTATLQAIRQY